VRHSIRVWLRHRRLGNIGGTAAQVSKRKRDERKSGHVGGSAESIAWASRRIATLFPPEKNSTATNIESHTLTSPSAIMLTVETKVSEFKPIVMPFANARAASSASFSIRKCHFLQRMATGSAASTNHNIVRLGCFTSFVARRIVGRAFMGDEMLANSRVTVCAVANIAV
jgi:hypothetical protein